MLKNLIKYNTLEDLNKMIQSINYKYGEENVFVTEVKEANGNTTYQVNVRLVEIK